MSQAEAELAFQLKAAKIKFEPQFRPFKDRKFAFDFRCWIAEWIKPVEVLVEVQGGAWMTPVWNEKLRRYVKRGAHGTGKSQERDCEKLSLAAVAGYRVICVTPAQIKVGLALSWIEQALKCR